MPLLLPFELALTRLKQVVHFAGSAGCNRPSIAYLFARARESLQHRAAAARHYSRALQLADRSSSGHMFKVRQLWEFLAERNHARMGQARVEDPLFLCSATPDPAGKVDTRTRRRSAGYYEASFTHRGLRIDGYLRPGVHRTHIELLLDDRVIARKLPARVAPGLSIFKFGVWRDALEMMPPRARLRLRLADGSDLVTVGSKSLLLETPHGRGVVDQGGQWRLDKKGFLVREAMALEDLQEGFLRIYDEAARALHARFGISLFVLYGTLLGQQRGQDFIPGDDDFDVGYFSSCRTSAAVRAEGMEIATELVRLGFIVTLNRNGRLFRVRLPGLPPICHLDVHAVWEERGSLWIHPRANLHCTATDFLPARTALLRDRTVLVPARPEAFLEAYYGKDWRVPDPSYSTAARSFPRWKSRHLARSFVSPVLFNRMRNTLGPTPDALPSGGRLIATGLHPLYPLERYERDCDW